MTKEITKAIVLQEIQDKFKLRDLISEKFTFNEMVNPVYNVEPHLTKWEIDSRLISISSASAFMVCTVPDNEEWLLRSYQVIFVGVSTVTVAGIYIRDRSTVSATRYIYLDLKAAQDVSYLVKLPVPVKLHPGNSLYISADGYTSTMDVSINMDLEKTEIR